MLCAFVAAPCSDGRPFPSTAPALLAAASTLSSTRLSSSAARRVPGSSPATRVSGSTVSMAADPARSMTWLRSSSASSRSTSRARVLLVSRRASTPCAPDAVAAPRRAPARSFVATAARVLLEARLRGGHSAAWLTCCMAPAMTLVAMARLGTPRTPSVCSSMLPNARFASSASTILSRRSLSCLIIILIIIIIIIIILPLIWPASAACQS